MLQLILQFNIRLNIIHCFHLKYHAMFKYLHDSRGLIAILKHFHGTAESSDNQFLFVFYRLRFTVYLNSKLN